MNKPLTTIKRADKKAKRRQHIKQALDLQQTEILEIGAFDNPTFTKEESDIYYCDYFSTSELKANFGKTRSCRVQNAVDVDYVIKDIYFAQNIPRKFDLIIANHVIEHIPNMIGWLQNLSLILKKNGLLFLTVPHKDYTFDKLRSPTNLWELIRNFEQNLLAPSVYQVADQLYYHRPVKARDIWQKKHQKLLTKQRFSNIAQAIQEAETKIDAKGYVDTHCNVFTYESFLQVFDELYKGKYIPLSLLSSSDVEQPDNEFYALLTKHNL